MSPLLAITATLAAYAVGLWLFARANRFPLLHPVVVAALPLAAWLWWAEIPYTEYAAATEWLSFLLGPATVALAVPLYEEWPRLRRLLLPILVTLLIGAAFAAGSALAIAHALGADALTLRSLAAKSVTTPIAIAVTETLQGNPSLAAGVVVFTGVVGAVLGPPLFRLLRIRDDRAQGFALGLAAHAVGTARAFEQGGRCGAYASLGLGLTGLLTALALPLIFAAFA